MPFLHTLLVLLTAAIFAVALAKRLGLGNVLGYLAAGLLIGPSGLALVSNVDSIAQVSELGVVMLLFIIGLELRPQRLWTMRRTVLILGPLQLLVTTAAVGIAAHALGVAWTGALILGFVFSMSSTAIVLPMLSERDLIASQAGRMAFGVLLFQDLAVIPIIVLIPLLGGNAAALSWAMAWPAVLRALAALSVVLIGGRLVIRPIFRIIDGAKTPEIFTATALVIVVGTAVIVNLAGLSMSLGAFMAGLLLSDSEYRHELKADIEPFEGLLLGMFFISVGMSANLALLMAQWVFVMSAVTGLLMLKAGICFGLAKFGKRENSDAIRFAFALAQAGEFGFVILGNALGRHILTHDQMSLATLIITLSMIATPILFFLSERFILPVLRREALKPYDDPGRPEHAIIICGFGRVGQIVGRILRMEGIGFTALDKSVEQVELVRRFGNMAYYGDPTRAELLRAAGAEEARILVVALDDVNESLAVVEQAQRHFPHLKILVRARNRRHVYLLMDRGVEHAVRETFHSSLKLTEMVLLEAGVTREEAKRAIGIFEDYDERKLREQHAVYHDEKELIQSTRQIAEELQQILEEDRRSAPVEERLD